jgi:hypothetical protein
VDRKALRGGALHWKYNRGKLALREPVDLAQIWATVILCAETGNYSAKLVDAGISVVDEYEEAGERHCFEARRTCSLDKNLASSSGWPVTLSRELLVLQQPPHCLPSWLACDLRSAAIDLHKQTRHCPLFKTEMA